MNHIRQQIFHWQKQGLIAKGDIDKSLKVSQAQPNTQQWYNFIKSSLLYLSVLSIACGIIFFFAYNWSKLSSFNKFAIIQGLMVISTFIYSQTQRLSYIRNAVCLLMVMLIGALFALFGQTYQTGKDPWQLFALWTFFTTPLAFHARSSMIWLLWLGLLNLSLALFIDANNGLFGIIFNDQNSLLLFVYFNALALVLFELMFHKNILFNRYASQCAAIVVMITSTSLASFAILDKDFHGLYLLTYVLWMMAAFYFYRRQSVDILILASGVISTICVITVIFIKIFDNILDDGGFLLLSILIIGLSTAGIKWLKQVIKTNHDKGVVS